MRGPVGLSLFESRPVEVLRHQPQRDDGQDAASRQPLHPHRAHRRSLQDAWAPCSGDPDRSSRGARRETPGRPGGGGCSWRSSVHRAPGTSRPHTRTTTRPRDAIRGACETSTPMPTAARTRADATGLARSSTRARRDVSAPRGWDLSSMGRPGVAAAFGTRSSLPRRRLRGVAGRSCCRRPRGVPRHQSDGSRSRT